MDGPEHLPDFGKKRFSRREALGLSIGALAATMTGASEAQEATGEEIFAKEAGSTQERKMLARQLLDLMQTGPAGDAAGVSIWDRTFTIGSVRAKILIFHDPRRDTFDISIQGDSATGKGGFSFDVRDWGATGDVAQARTWNFAPLSMKGVDVEFSFQDKKRDPKQVELAHRLYKGIMEAILARF